MSRRVPSADRRRSLREQRWIQPCFDLYYKDDALGDPLLTEARVQLVGGGEGGPSVSN
jgi:hypothetical protein